MSWYEIIRYRDHKLSIANKELVKNRRYLCNKTTARDDIIWIEV